MYVMFMFSYSAEYFLFEFFRPEKAFLQNLCEASTLSFALADKMILRFVVTDSVYPGDLQHFSVTPHLECIYLLLSITASVQVSLP